MTFSVSKSSPLTFSEVVEASGETRAAWAAKLCISAGFLSDLLNGNRMPSLQLAARIEFATDGVVVASGWIERDTAA